MAVDVQSEIDMSVMKFGRGVPRGAYTVLRRVVQDGAKVPLFFGQTLVHSLRNLGYTNTTSALCEHVDNAIQWGASEVRVYFHQQGKRGAHEIDVLVLDNGQGMAPNVLKIAMAFGGSMVYDNREGIGRFGVGMKAASLSMGPSLDVFSWQEQGAFYHMNLDVDAIGKDRANMIELPDPDFTESLPHDLSYILYNDMVYPKPETHMLDMFAPDAEMVTERLGRSGTLVYIPKCDRLTWRTARSLVDATIKEMARIYRYHLAHGLRLFINNLAVEPVDPTYATEARHTDILEQVECSDRRSRLVQSWELQIPTHEDGTLTYPVTVRLYALPIAAWASLPRQTLNKMQVYDNHTVSFMRNHREVDIGTPQELVGKRHTNHAFLRLQIDFPGELDEAFGVAVNKQGVRPKSHVLRDIKKAIKDDLSNVRAAIFKYQADRASARGISTLTPAEQQAMATDAFQAIPLPRTEQLTEQDTRDLEENLRGLAVGCRREGETEEEAFERIQSSTYITVFKHDQYWPFYHVEYKFGKVLLTINTAHGFFTKLYEPLSKLAHHSAAMESLPDQDDGTLSDTNLQTECTEALTALQLLLLSLARTQAEMTANDPPDDDHRGLFRTLRETWSRTLDTQLMNT